MEKPAVVVDNVSMKFNLSKEKLDSLKDYVIKFLKKEIKYNEFWALQNVDFEVKKGDRVGILGLNGAGKSTLLKVIAGVFKPTEGKVVRNGRMKARLGFSIATLVSPDILILDEVLSVGDAKFRKKSEKKVLSMFDKGVTVLFVSHSLEQVQRLCNKAMILEKGKLIAYGDIDEISAKYTEMIR